MRVSKQQIKFYCCENLQFTVIYEQAGGKLSNIQIFKYETEKLD